MIRVNRTLALFSAALMIGCGSRDVGSNEYGLAELLPSSHSLSLVLLPLKQVYAPGDSVRIAFLLHNTGAPLPLRLQPGFLSFQIVGPAGETLPIQPGPGYEIPLLGSLPELTLATDGLVGGLVNLACRRNPYELVIQDSDQTRAGIPDTGECIWMFDLTQSGAYIIVGRFRVPTLNLPTETPPSTIDLTSNPVIIHVSDR